MFEVRIGLAVKGLRSNIAAKGLKVEAFHNIVCTYYYNYMVHLVDIFGKVFGRKMIFFYTSFFILIVSNPFTVRYDYTPTYYKH